MTAYLSLNLGSDRTACLDLIDEARRLDAEPNEYVITSELGVEYQFSVSFELKSQLEKYLRNMLRRADEMDVDRCDVELRQVLVQIDADGSVMTGKSLNGAWNGISSGYVATDPKLTEIRHVVSAPRNARRPADVPGEWSVI